MKTFTPCVSLVLMFFFHVNCSYTQVGVNNDGSAPHISAMLDVKSNVKGLLIPRMTTAERVTLSATATAGLMVYDTDQNKFYFHNGSDWKEGAIGNLWLTDGNNIFLNDINDSVGIGTINPQRKFETLGDSKIARLSSASNSSFLEFSSTAPNDWAIGESSTSFRFASSTDNFTTTTDEFLMSQNAFTPGIDNSKSLGTSTKYWNSIYGVKGYFSDNVLIGSTISLGKLHIHDGGSANSMVYITPATATSGDSSAIFLAEDNDATYGMYWLYDGGGNFMELWGKSNGIHYGPHLMVDRTSGNMAIGNTLATGYKLSVSGKIICTELRVNLVADWPDYVLNKDYNLMPLYELRDFIKEKGHLPNVPSAVDIEESGIDVGVMQKLMMEKIEELSLYILKQQEEIDELKAKLDKENK